MKPSLRTNGLLLACVLLLLVLCWASVSAPLRFARQRQQREAVVKERLLLIRQAQAAYLRAKGSYAADLHTLVAGGYMADSVQYIPYAGGKRFELSTTVLAGKSGRNVPLMECGAAYADYLRGMDATEIDNMTRQAEEAGQYAGLKIGDLTTANDNAGNWE